MRGIPTIYFALPSDTPGHVLLAVFDQRSVNPEQNVKEQLANALFFDEMPAMGAIQIVSGLASTISHVAQSQASAMRQRFYERVISEHQLNPADPEQNARLNAIISGFGAHDLDPTFKPPEAHP